MRKQKIINNTNPPSVDNRGRAFPYRESHTHFVGPALVGGKLFRMSVWWNTSIEGRPYLRVVFEEPSDEEKV